MKSEFIRATFTFNSTSSACSSVEKDVEAPGSAQVLDASGKYVLPGDDDGDGGCDDDDDGGGDDDDGGGDDDGSNDDDGGGDDDDYYYYYGCDGDIDVFASVCLWFW